MPAAPGAAGQGDAVGKPWRQWGEWERGEPPAWARLAKFLGGGCCVGAGYFCCTDKSSTGLNDIKRESPTQIR